MLALGMHHSHNLTPIGRDLSVPVYIDDKHWDGFRIGYVS